MSGEDLDKGNCAILPLRGVGVACWLCVVCCVGGLGLGCAGVRCAFAVCVCGVWGCVKWVV